MGRYDANGPVILWIDYGTDGWAPRSYDTVEEALSDERTTSKFIITRRVGWRVVEA